MRPARIAAGNAGFRAGDRLAVRSGSCRSCSPTASSLPEPTGSISRAARPCASGSRPPVHFEHSSRGTAGARCSPTCATPQSTRSSTTAWRTHSARSKRIWRVTQYGPSAGTGARLIHHAVRFLAAHGVHSLPETGGLRAAYRHPGGTRASATVRHRAAAATRVRCDSRRTRQACRQVPRRWRLRESRTRGFEPYRWRPRGRLASKDTYRWPPRCCANTGGSRARCPTGTSVSFAATTGENSRRSLKPSHTSTP